MQNRFLRHFLTDRGKLVALALSVLFLVALGVGLSKTIASRMLRADAESTAQAWAGTLLESADDIPAMIGGKSPSERTSRLLSEAVEIGDVYRYRLWDSNGRQVAVSGRTQGLQNPKSMVKRCGVQGAREVLSGSTCTVIDISHLSADPLHYACSYVPVVRNGTVLGVLEVYVDLTDHFALYEKSFLLNDLITALAILFAGGMPVSMVYRKMKAHRAAQAEAQFLADHDNLTGIANRKRLSEAASAALAWSRRSQSQVALFMLDVDHFKDINDNYGHTAGDELLRKLARRIRLNIREEDTVARWGGDEFVILQVGIAQPTGAKALADRLLAAFAEPYEICGMQITCGSSIGVAIAPSDAVELERLFSCADSALYKAKAAGRNTACFFHPGMDASLRERQRMEKDIQRALQTKAFGVAYQPISSFREGAILGFEALVRWPEGWPPHSPKEFIPIAEEAGLMPLVGAWVLETACVDAASWEEPLKLAVNLSPVQFRTGDIVATVADALRVSGLKPERLELEIAESLWIENTDAVLEQLARLKQLGVSITLDNFGTGNSSLKYLWKFPFDRVKIDRSFVEEMETDPKAAAIVNTIVALGTTLHLTVTAEGVETLAQAQMLNKSGCEQAQGFLLGGPRNATSANALIKAGPPFRLAQFAAEIQQP